MFVVKITDNLVFQTLKFYVRGVGVVYVAVVRCTLPGVRLMISCQCRDNNALFSGI